MKAVLNRRLLFILHRGWVEARLLAQRKRFDQLYDLADALEPVSGYMNDWKDEDLESILFNLATYQKKHGTTDSFDYLSMLQGDEEPPERF